MKFRKKPVVIEAIKWTGENFDEIKEFVGESLFGWEPETVNLEIHTLEGKHLASKGDWIIKGVKGEFYPCKPDIFALTYDFYDAENEIKKTLINTTASQAKENVKDIKFWGDGDIFKLISKASSVAEGWMKSTKAMEIFGIGCVIQVTTQQGDNVAEALTFVPNTRIAEFKDDNGNIVVRQVVGNLVYDVATNDFIVKNVIMQDAAGDHTKVKFGDKFVDKFTINSEKNGME
jgi:hypothetical protein